MMNVLFYVPWLDQSWGGSKQYSAGILKVLAGFDPAAFRIFVYHNTKDPDILNTLAHNPHLVHISDDTKPGILTRGRRKLQRGINTIRNVFSPDKKEVDGYIDNLCKDHNIDVIYCPYQYLPAVHSDVKLICTLHDVQELHFPAFFSAETRAARAVNYLDYLNRAHAVIVSYDHIRKDLLKFFNLDPSKVFIVLLNFSKLWFEKFDRSQVTANTQGKYLLYPANTWEHKNHINLIKAVALLRDKYQLSVQVVCTGHINEHGAVIRELIRELQLEDQVSLRGVVEEPELYSLYHNAYGVVVPTLYEAGSFPLMESILLDVPVICSDVTSLPETIGDDTFVFDPHDVRDIAEKIRLIYTDDAFRAKLKAHLPSAKEKLMSSDVDTALKTAILSVTKHNVK